MKTIKLLPIALLITVKQLYAQTTNNKKEISILINKYAKSVIEKDSTTFYDLFNDGPVTWCAALKDRSQAREVARKGAGSNYFSGSYKGFFRSLFRYKSTEDKFDNIQIVEDGTVASVTMDYSFWADNKMTNWGGKYLLLIKRDGKWKITSVIFSLDLTGYFEQPPLKERQKSSLPGAVQ
ncbi:Cif family virulence factor [Mucilaginibacter frigoritolerans]|nr:nuclear transport factor 2 family protein [Mucilaginibacter frigoritolerans]